MKMTTMRCCPLSARMAQEPLSALSGRSFSLALCSTALNNPHTTHKICLQDDDIDIPALRKYIMSRTPEEAAKALNKMEVPGGPLGTMRLMWQVVFGGEEEPPSLQIEAKQEYITAFLEDANSQLALLGGLEHFVTIAEPNHVKDMAKTLKVLYDLDIVEEEVILAWNKRAGIAEVLGVKPEQTAEVRKFATPVINWLEEADEESDDE